MTQTAKDQYKGHVGADPRRLKEIGIRYLKNQGEMIDMEPQE